MKNRLCCLLATCLIGMVTTGCFELEAEIKVLSDGSGFVTVWAQMPVRIASIGASLQDSTLAEQQQAVLTQLDRRFENREGIRLVERLITTADDDLILRYRYAFDGAKELNAFWADPENSHLDVLLYKTRLDFQKTGEGCGAQYRAELTFQPRTAEEMIRFEDSLFGGQATDVNRQMIEEYYQGGFRLRLVLPGKITGADAETYDTGGYPIWRAQMLELYVKGLTAKAASQVICQDGTMRLPAKEESPPEPSQPLSEGPKPSLAEVARVFDNLGDLLTLEIDAEVGEKSTLEVRYRIDGRLDPALAGWLQLPVATFPTLTADWQWTQTRDKDGQLVLSLRTRKPLRLHQTDSPYLFAGPDGDQLVFRLKLPALVSGRQATPETIGPVVVRANVKMTGPIKTSNATLIEDQTATWILTARDVTQPLTLEVICDR